MALSHLIVFPSDIVMIRQAAAPARLCSPARAVLYNQGCEYTAQVVGGRSELSHFIRIAPEVAVDAVRGFDPARSPDAPFAMTDAPVGDRMYIAQRVLGAAVARREPDGLYLEELLLSCVGRIIRDSYFERGGRRSNAHREDAHARRAQEAIARTFRCNLSIGELSDIVDLSPFHLCRVFKRHCGTTIHQFRDTLRARAAVRAIADGMELPAAALSVGYASQSHLTNIFRKRLGLTPGMVRESLRCGGTRALSNILEDRRFAAR